MCLWRCWLLLLLLLQLECNNLFAPCPSPSPLSGQEDIVKQFDLQCYVKWARKCWIFLGSSLEFKWFEGCLDAAKIQCAAPFLSQKLSMIPCMISSYWSHASYILCLVYFLPILFYFSFTYKTTQGLVQVCICPNLCILLKTFYVETNWA